MFAWVLLKNTGGSFFHDNGLFLAMGLAFNLLLYFIPITLLMISLLGYTVLDSERAMVEVQSVVRQFLPASEQQFVDSLSSIVADRGLLGLIGFLLFISFSSTLFGSARHVLNIIFKTEQQRSFLQGLGRDFLMMLLTAFLAVLAMSVAAFLTLARTVGREHLPVLGPVLEPVWMSAAKLLTWYFWLACSTASIDSLPPGRCVEERYSSLH